MNTKHRLTVLRHERAHRRSTAIAGTLVTPGRSTRGSWWTTASPDGFTAQASRKPATSEDLAKKDQRVTS